MNLYAKLLQRKDNPLRIGLIGAGKFAAMYLAQVPRTPGVELVAIADLSPANAKENLKRVGWDPNRIPPITEDWQKLVANPKVDIIVEADSRLLETPYRVVHMVHLVVDDAHVELCYRYDPAIFSQGYAPVQQVDRLVELMPADANAAPQHMRISAPFLVDSGVVRTLIIDGGLLQPAQQGIVQRQKCVMVEI